jgi:hypothetical protein
MMSQAGISFEPIAHELKPSDHGDDVADLEQDLGGLKTSPSSSNDHVSPDQGHDKSVAVPSGLTWSRMSTLTPLCRQKWASMQEVSCRLPRQAVADSSPGLIAARCLPTVPIRTSTLRCFIVSPSPGPCFPPRPH